MKKLAFVACLATALSYGAAGGDVFGAPVKVEGTSSQMMAVCLEGNRL